MTRKAKKLAKKGHADITVVQRENESEERAVARTSLSPSLHSALTVKDFTKSTGELNLMSLFEELQHQERQTIHGNLDRAEAMLTAQAHTLDAIFNNLARRAIYAKYLPNFDTFLKLGLRAQSQCRATWESLALIKNPVGRAYVGQANFANNQQINNKVEPSRTRENQNLPNELLEKKDGERLDSGSQAAAGGANQDLDAVGTVNRADDYGGQEKIRKKRIPRR